MKKKMIPPENLLLCPLDETLAHIFELMDLANKGVPDADRIARVALDRYFERIDEDS